MQRRTNTTDEESELGDPQKEAVLPSSVGGAILPSDRPAPNPISQRRHQWLQCGIVSVLLATLMLTLNVSGILQIKLEQHKLPTYSLLDKNNRRIDATDHEAYEQRAMAKYIRAGDVVWNLGVDIGTSCITAEKLSRGGGSKLHTVCVEPNNHLLPLLATNFKDNHVEEIELLSGILCDTAHCPNDVPVHGSGQDDSVSGPVDRLPKVMTYANTSFKVQACYTMDHLMSLSGSRMASVFFADCEGCLPMIFRQFRAHFARPELRVVIYERDADDRLYPEMEQGLVEEGFRLMESGFVCVWLRGPFHLTLNVWPLFHKVLVVSGITLVLDRLAAFVLPAVFQHFPFWRFLLIPYCIENNAVCIAGPLCRGFGNIWNWNLLDGIWHFIPYRWNSWVRAGFPGLVKHLLLYVSLIWPAARHLAQDVRYARAVCYLVFVTSTAGGYVLAEVQGVMEKSFQPEQSIWQLSVCGAIVLGIAALLKERLHAWTVVFFVFVLHSVDARILHINTG